MAGSGKQPSAIQEQIKELLEAGFDPTTIHRRLKVGRSSIYRMKRCLQQHGTNYMPPEMNKKNGRPKVLTPDQELEVKHWLRDPKNRTRYLDDLVWLIHDRFAIVCSTTTMSKIKRKWLRVIEYEESGTPIDDLTRSQLLETHPNLPLLHEPQAPAAQMSSQVPTSTSPERQLATQVAAKVAAQMADSSASASDQEQATTSGAQQSSPAQPQQSFLQSPSVQIPQQISPPPQQTPLARQRVSSGQHQFTPAQQQLPAQQQSSSDQQQLSPVPQHFSPTQQRFSLQQQASSGQQQISSQQPHFPPVPQQFSPHQQQLNAPQQPFTQSPTLQMQMQAQIMVGAAHFTSHVDASQLPHDFQGDFEGDMGAQHLSA